MDTEAHFENIHERLQDLLGSATTSITAAVAWFTDDGLFDVLCRKAALGLDIRLLLIEDAINTGKNRLNFERFRDMGGEVFFIPDPKRGGKMMHNKFVVIDQETVVTGSYNWSKQAQKNHENITVVRGDIAFAEKYLAAFDDIIGKYGFQSKSMRPPDMNTVLQRLDMIKNAIRLDEYDTASNQINRLRPFARDIGLDDLFQTYDSEDFDSVIDQIEQYRMSRQSVVEYRDPEIEALRLELKTLEAQITALSDEKAETQRQISEFSTRHTLHLGELLREYYQLRRDKFDRQRKKEDAQREKSEQAYESAHRDYEDFKREYTAAKEKDPPPKLSQTDQSDLKKLYREASQLCHPDKVAEHDKDQAHKVFVELQQAYQSNDITEVKSILDRLKGQTPFDDPAETLDDTKILKSEIRRLREQLDELVKELAALKSSETFRTLSAASDWDQYFEEQATKLSREIDDLKTELRDG